MTPFYHHYLPLPLPFLISNTTTHLSNSTSSTSVSSLAWSCIGSSGRHHLDQWRSVGTWYVLLTSWSNQRYVFKIKIDEGILILTIRHVFINSWGEKNQFLAYILNIVSNPWPPVIYMPVCEPILCCLFSYSTSLHQMEIPCLHINSIEYQRWIFRCILHIFLLHHAVCSYLMVSLYWKKRKVVIFSFNFCRLSF